MKRGDFEEVPRLSAATAGESRLVRRWAENRSPYSPLSHLRWQLSQRESQVGADVLGGPRRPGRPGAGAIFQYNPSFSFGIIQNVARQDTKNPVGQARGGAFLPHPACIIPKPVKKLEKLFIAPKVRQVLYETSQRVFTRCACAQRTGFLIKFFNQESVSGRLGQILRKLWQSVHWSMEGWASWVPTWMLDRPQLSMSWQ